MNIVMISGKQGSGKTTLAKELSVEWQQRPAGSCVIYKFADALYEMHDAILNILEAYYPGRNVKKDGPLLQLLGTEWGRNTVDPNVWVDIMQNKVKILESAIEGSPRDFLVIIDDCRFENEFEAFPKALRIRLECAKEIRKSRAEAWRDKDNHSSEVGLDVFADRGAFDLLIRTENSSVSSNVKYILGALDDRSPL